jgi:hypothetical protein
MRVVRATIALAAVVAAAACGTAEVTAPAAPSTPARAATVHRNEGFLGSGNNVTAPTPPDTITSATTGKSP